jgi:hypothetical protein
MIRVTVSRLLHPKRSKQMKFLELLSKLGIMRYGATAATYKSAVERPIELQDSSVFNAKRDLTTKEDVKKVLGKAPAAKPAAR